MPDMITYTETAALVDDLRHYFEDVPLVRKAADAIEELLAKLPTWISVEERLPEDGKNVLVLYQNGDMAVAHIYGHDEHINFWRVCTDEGWESDGDAEPSH